MIFKKGQRVVYYLKTIILKLFQLIKIQNIILLLSKKTVNHQGQKKFLTSNILTAHT